jgi:2-hydroxycyclohexanecarboxyl-CoA dehydrogenase
MTDRVALITGAGAGVGRSVALRLASQGIATTVAVNDLDAERAKHVANEVDAAGARGIPCPADVTSWKAVSDMVAALTDAAGAVHVLVNNAGIPSSALPAPFATSDPADWAPWINLNLLGVMYCTRAVLPSMLEAKWGRVITVVSDAARVGESGLTPYAAAKAGAAGFTRSVAREVGASGITANSVALGTIKHGVVADFLDDATEASMLKRYVIKRLGTTDDPAALIAFLAGDDAGWITGQTYPVNGGFSMTQ